MAPRRGGSRTSAHPGRRGLLGCTSRGRGQMTEPVPGARRALGAMLAAARRSARAGRGARPGEVAERAGLGEGGSGGLEGGRTMGFSPVPLGGVAGALALRGPARERLFGLAGLEEADELSPIVEPMRPSVRDFIEAVDPYPA